MAGPPEGMITVQVIVQYAFGPDNEVNNPRNVGSAPTLYQFAVENVILIRVKWRFMLWPPGILGGSYGKSH